jgi:hypothetical protein
MECGARLSGLLLVRCLFFMQVIINPLLLMCFHFRQKGRSSKD